jgi:mRNA interferase YafQ
MRGLYRKTLEKDLGAIVNLLDADAPIPGRYRDHPLSGSLQDVRDCHIRPDLVLIYRKVGDDTLELVRLGSHSELDL